MARAKGARKFRRHGLSHALASAGAAVERLEARALLAAAGDLDTTFSGDGVAFYNNSGFSVESGQAIAVQSDGKVVVAGATGDGSASGDILLLRYNADGTPDSTFDTDGVVITDLPNDASLSAIAIQAD